MSFNPDSSAPNIAASSSIPNWVIPYIAIIGGFLAIGHVTCTIIVFCFCYFRQRHAVRHFAENNVNAPAQIPIVHTPLLQMQGTLARIEPAPPEIGISVGEIGGPAALMPRFSSMPLSALPQVPMMHTPQLQEDNLARIDATPPGMDIALGEIRRPAAITPISSSRPLPNRLPPPLGISLTSLSGAFRPITFAGEANFGTLRTSAAALSAGRLDTSTTQSGATAIFRRTADSTNTTPSTPESTP